MKAGELFNELVKEHKSRCEGSNWDNALHGEKTLKGILNRADLDKIRVRSRRDFQLRETCR